MWISSEFPGNPKFNALISHKYEATVARVSFRDGEGQRAVGDWIAQQSGGDLHGVELGQLTNFVIANIQVFDGEWSVPFNPKNTRVDTFRGRRAKETVQMMSEFVTAPYISGPDGEMVTLDYAGPYRLALFLPKTKTDPPLRVLLRHAMQPSIAASRVVVMLPKIHVNTAESLGIILRSLGVHTAFGSSADFSPMLGTKENGGGNIYQDVDLKIDEQGTIAKALTEGVKLQKLVHPPSHMIKFDRPFAFAIQRTGDHPAIVFEGQILDVKDSSR